MAFELEEPLVPTVVDPQLFERQSAVLRKLEKLVRDRTEAVEATESTYRNRRAAAVEQAEQGKTALEQQSSGIRKQAEQAYKQAVANLNAKFQAEHGRIEQEYVKLKQRIAQRLKQGRALAKRALDEGNFETQTVFDATKSKPRREFLEIERQVNARAERLEQINNDGKVWLLASRMAYEPTFDPAGTPVAEGADPLKLFIDGLAQAEERLVQLQGLKAAKFFQGSNPVGVVMGCAMAGAGLAYMLGAQTNGLIAGVVGGLVIGGGAIVGIYQMVSHKVREIYDPLTQTLIDTQLARQRWFEQATEKWQRETADIKQRYESDLNSLTEKYDASKVSAHEASQIELAEIESKYPPRLADLKAKHQKHAKELEAKFRQHVTDVQKTQFGKQTDEVARAEQELVEIDAKHQRDWQSLVAQWRQGLAEVEAEVSALAVDTAAQFPDWDSPAWDNWQPPLDVARSVRFGQIEVRLNQIQGAATDDERLQAGLDAAYRLPALLEFPQRCSVSVRATGARGRIRAVELIQAAMLRFLTAVPPGKLRFTIVDPVGLGQNFAGFMHLADYEEQLVSFKIWTEPPQIEQRLSDMTAHMSNVIQKYLRNEYASIQDYNRHAGEVAEAFRVLVVANFPVGFTDAAIRHLLSVVTSGARCGVYTLITIDTKVPLPHGFRLPDLEQNSARLQYREETFVWKDDVFEQFPLTIEGPPSQERFSQIVHMVGEGAKHANRVEVPFEFIAPEYDDWWTGDASRSVDIALGRAGATKRQFLRLGRGTAQHVLVAGKTGSGKSTLMHALITNLALQYSPEEVELYLIDFKKGVEFKAYAEFKLPHARVIAIESEREFGLSVLQRLDVELKSRGELYRDLGVADLGGYRQGNGPRNLPRILLIVDEFQEFFVEDDKIAQDVSLLLDRLVRQGRAFGIHVTLGSQTLGGSYSLPRTTLGQFAIRIALQCSEADANLILSEENAAARLLTRPGEAIYNDANGRSEGNNLFQVVWLSDEKHDSYLSRVRELGELKHFDVNQIVFEGNKPADITKNVLLTNVLTAQLPTAPSANIWMGEAIAIKDPTAAIVRQQSGANILILGQQPEGTLSMMSVAMIALAAQQPRAEFFVLDGQAPDSNWIGTFPRIARVLPDGMEYGGIRDTVRIMGMLAEEQARREATAEADATPLYLFIYDLQRFRDLRKADDDFSFSRGAEKVSPGKQLATLLREGPAVGIHVIIWADTLNNVQRSFDRQAMREFETRVLFQMSVGDSSSLIDSPAASKLGPLRAMLHSEEQGRLEKFRPYRMPDDEWLAKVGVWLRQRQAFVPAKPSRPKEDPPADASPPNPLTATDETATATRGLLET